MYSDPLSTTTPAVVGIDSPDCVKWRETLPSQEESAGRDIPMGRLVTKVLVSRESPFPPCHWVRANVFIYCNLCCIYCSFGVVFDQRVSRDVHIVSWYCVYSRLRQSRQTYMYVREREGVCVSVSVCHESVFVSVCLCVCVSVLLCVYVSICKCLSVAVHVYVRVYICLFLFLFLCLFLCICVCVCVCVVLVESFDL